MLKRILLTLLLALSVSTTAAAQATYVYDGKVVRLKDGDTLVLEIAGWPAPFNPIDVRVDGIDTPESRQTSGKKKIKKCELAMGRKSSAYAKSILRPGDMVKVIYKEGRHEKYGRLLADITLPNGKDMATEMISAGHAKAYDGGAKRKWC